MTRSSSPTSEASLDRIAPTLRPGRRVVMHQNWRHLSFLHWEVAPESIRPLLPPGLELDLYEGRAYVGLVPFTMTGVRPVWLPPFAPLSDFDETNVRTYVHVGGRDPGVWFFSLDAAHRLAVLGARATFHLPYHFARMNLTARESIIYLCNRRWPGPVPATTNIEVVPRGEAAPVQVGALEHFLIERYFLYAARGKRLYRGQVHHTPYPVQTAELVTLDETLVAAAGISRPAEPPLVHYVRGVDVEVFALQRVRG